MPPHRLRAAEVDEVAGRLDATDRTVEGAGGAAQMVEPGCGAGELIAG